jgi:signal transduction histidine kinase
MFDLIINFLTQLGGGPGSAENNLVRFGLPALFWAVLFIVAWARQRGKPLPRERLLLFGFGLFFARELFMFLHTVERIVVGPQSTSHSSYIEPLEHALAASAVLVISAAFLRYILDDIKLPRRYLLIGLTAVGFGVVISFLLWPAQQAANPDQPFHSTIGAWIMHGTKAIFIILAIILLIRNKGWVSNVVIIALTFLLISVVLTFVNILTGRTYATVICPISNNFHIWAVPIFGFVYFREQSIAKKEAESKLATYRDHLEQLVDQRTAELATANQQLQLEVTERTRAETVITRRNAELTAQNLIAATISRSLDLDELLRAALDQTLELLDMDSGCILLRDAAGNLEPQIFCHPKGYCANAAENNYGCTYMTEAQHAILSFEPQSDSWAKLGQSKPAAEGGKKRFFITVPLVAHGRAFGAMTLVTFKKARVNKDQVAILASIGQQVGVAVENARLFQEAEQWAKGMSRLHEISLELNAILEPDELCRLVTMQAATLLKSSAAGLFRLAENGSIALGVASYRMVEGGVNGIRLPVSNSEILKQLVDYGEPVVIEDVHRDPRIHSTLWKHYPMRALLAVPVRGTGNMQGVLFLIEATRTRCWQPSEIRLLQNFTNRAGVAWENAFLQKQLEWAAALEERQRIAAEMHDGLAQTISMLALRNDQAAQMLEHGNLQPALSELGEIQDVISVAANDLRRSIASLRESPKPPCPLQEALGELKWIDEKGETREIQFVCDLEMELHLPAEEMDQIVCIVKEALLNAARHANPNKIEIRLDRHDSYYAISVEDDGRGFDVDSVTEQAGNHFGLSIMLARAKRLGGELTIQSEPGLGTCVLLTWRRPDDDYLFQHVASGFEAAEKLFPERKLYKDRELWEN